MSDLNKKELQKSLDEIEAMADEILSKSEETENIQEGVDVPKVEAVDENAQVEGDVEKAMKPEDISEPGEDDKAESDKKAEAEDKKDEKPKPKESEDEENSEDDSEDDSEDEEEVTQKSFNDFVAESEELSKGVEVSDFLAEFTRVYGAITDTLRNDVNKSLQTSEHVSNILAKSFNAIMKSQNELVKSIQELSERLDSVERQPVGRKAQVSIMEKSFNHSAGLEEGKQELSKSEKLEKLSNMAINGQHGVTISDVIQFESTGTLRPELQHLFKENQ